MQKNIIYLIKGALAGMAVSIAGVAYLYCDSKYVSGCLFSLALLSIFTFDWNLYTGKCCYVVDNPPSYLYFVGATFVGNFIGCFSVAMSLQLTKHSALIEVAQHSVESKLANTPIGAIILGVFCGILMYIAVLGYKVSPYDTGKFVVPVLAIMIFILCGFEHVIANMFYISMANAWSLETLIYTLYVAIGNLLGCSLVPFCNKLVTMLQSENATKA